MEEYTPVQPFEVLSARLGRRPEEIVKLDANENPYGPSPRVRQALAAFPWYHIYPDPQQFALRDALSQYVGVPADYILPGHGADELLDYLCRLFLTPGDAIVNCPPTFGMYSFDAKLSGGRVIDVWRGEDFSLDIEGIEQRRGGRAASEAALPDLTQQPRRQPDPARRAAPTAATAHRRGRGRSLHRVRRPSTGSGSAAPWVPDAPNLVVLRTFTNGRVWPGYAWATVSSRRRSSSTCGNSSSRTTSTSPPPWPG